MRHLCIRFCSRHTYETHNEIIHRAGIEVSFISMGFVPGPQRNWFQFYLFFHMQCNLLQNSLLTLSSTTNTQLLQNTQIQVWEVTTSLLPRGLISMGFSLKSTPIFSKWQEEFRVLLLKDLISNNSTKATVFKGITKNDKFLKETHADFFSPHENLTTSCSLYTYANSTDVYVL